MAQTTTGTLRGVVVDPNGGAIAGATVTAKNEATGTVAGPVTTSGEGTYEFGSLQPGTYAVTAEAPGFKRSVSTGVSVKLGIVNPYDVKLETGNVAETVTVTANTEEVVQRDQSQISTTVDTRRIAELPSNGAGGGLDTLALLAPGVIANNASGTNTNGTGLSVNGNRGRSNNFQIDGADNNDLSVSGPAMFVDNQDQVQEYQIITNNFSAQYGRNQGAVVNIVTKGGTNEYHGTAFEFHQDNKNLNSLNNIEKRGGQTEPNQSLYNVFGGTFGGPLHLPRFGEGGKSYYSGKDRFFFFLTYQGIRNPSISTLRDTQLSILPAEFPRLLAAFPGNGAIEAITRYSSFAIPGARPRSDVANPFSTITLGGQTFQTALVERDVSTPFKETDYSARFDIRASQKDNVTVRFLKQSQIFVNNLATVNGFTGDVVASSRNFGGIWTRQISNSIVSEARATYQKIGVVFGGGCDQAVVGCIPDAVNIGSAVTSITFPVVSGSRALSAIGGSTALPQGRVGKVYQLADNINWVRGRHSLILGAEYKHLNTVVPFLPNFNGAYSFNSVARLLANAPSGFSLTVGDPTLAFTEDDQYYFIQDDFKIRPNLTLNLGLRYEYTGQPINLLNEVSVARENDPARRFYNPALPLSARTVPLIPKDKNNFAPRLGFAYSPHFWKSFFGEDATVIRGGFSIAYDPAFYNILLNVQGGAPFSAAFALPSTSLPATNSPVPIPQGALTGDVIRARSAASGVLPLGQLNPLFLAQTTVAPDFRAPYSEQFSLGVQHQFGRNSVAEVRYVGTHGVGLFQNRNGNPFVQNLVNGVPSLTVCTARNAAGDCTAESVQTFRSFANLLPSGITPLSCVNDPATPFVNESVCNGRILRQSTITVRENSAQSIYHSMQSRYNGRFLNNALSLGAAYTWSKTIDNSSEIFALGIASSNTQNPFCITSCERSLSILDRPHAFSANFIYDVPFFKEQRGVVGHLLGGWQLNGVYVLTSGTPYTPGQFFNGSVFGAGASYITAGDRPFVGNPNVDPRLVGINQLDAYRAGYIDVVTNPKGFLSLNELNTTGNVRSVTPNDVRFIFNGPGSAQVFNTPFGDASRNSLRGPALNQLNMGLFKNIKVFERLTVQLRGEAYNVLNHPNPGYGVNGAGSQPDFFTEDAGIDGSAFAEKGDITLARRVVQVGIRIIF
ncbi:MAG TPA: carboxypeptidase regulatory-like domain-containing protein [Pyrinomonadaceae bacterium]|nr:carboxypeptidase regulatory-like domain-containing protein [Pyrinomonadaceae bacterium]